MRFVVFLFIFFLLYTGSLYAIDTKGLVLYLPLDEGSGKIAKDVSGSGNNGELKGNAEWVDGHSGKALHLTKSGDYVEVPHSNSLDIRKQITLEVWAKVDAFVGDQHCAFISKGTTDQTGSYILHISNDNGFYAALVIFIGVQGPWPPPAIGKTTMKEWHYFAGSYDGAELRIYIDGELMAKANRSTVGDIDSSKDPVAIGRDNRNPYKTTRTMDCIVDEARIWNRVLSENEIKEAMKGVFISVSPGGRLSNTWGEIKTGL